MWRRGSHGWLYTSPDHEKLPVSHSLSAVSHRCRCDVVVGIVLLSLYIWKERVKNTIPDVRLFSPPPPDRVAAFSCFLFEYVVTRSNMEQTTKYNTVQIKTYESFWSGLLFKTCIFPLLQYLRLRWGLSWSQLKHDCGSKWNWKIKYCMRHLSWPGWEDCCPGKRRQGKQQSQVIFLSRVLNQSVNVNC